MKRIALTVLGLLVLLSACGESEDHNAQDVSFAQAMIAHHRQAVEVSTYALAQATSPKVKDVATRIKAAQDPEIRTMKEWLSSWGEPDMASLGGSPNSTGGMGLGLGEERVDTGPGTIHPSQITQLRAATGAEFDRMFLTMMIKHQEGAVVLARTELANGKHAPSKELARKIVDAQQKEVTEMQALLAGGL